MNELPPFGAAARAEEVSSADAFTFGDPEPVLGARQLIDMVECPHNGRWYEPPLPLEGLARIHRASPHHSSAIAVKVNQVVSAVEPTPLLPRTQLVKLVQDHIVFGDGYLRRINNLLGRSIRFETSPARYTRRGLEPGQFFWVPGYLNEEEYRKGTVLQLSRPDLSQEIYGMPEYLAAMQAALLNEGATLFRRRYYENGSHAGYILYATGDIAETDTQALKEALKKSKGPGNFRSLFVHAPGGKEGSIKVIPIAEAKAADEFLNIKDVTRDDILAAHRVPPQLLGIVPKNAGGFGKPLDALDAFYELEILPLLGVLLEINEWAGFELIRIKPRAVRPVSPAPTAATA